MRIPFVTTLLSLQEILLPTRSNPPPCTKVETLYQFEKGTWVENIHTLRNGSLLVSLLDRPEIHMITPSTSPNGTATSTLIHSFNTSRYTSVLGITKVWYYPDMYAVVVANVSEPGSGSIYDVHLGYEYMGKFGRVRKFADLPDVGLPNGLATPGGYVMVVADSFGGDIVKGMVVGRSEDGTKYRSNVSRILQDESMMPIMEGGIGINGLQKTYLPGNKSWLSDAYLYYTNTPRGTLNRVKIKFGWDTLSSGEQMGDFELVASGLEGADDFAVRGDGSAVVARGRGADEVVFLNGEGGVEERVSVTGATGVALGMRRLKGYAYVSTSGMRDNEIVEGGKVVAIEQCLGSER